MLCEYGFLCEMRTLGVSAVMRIRNEPCMESIEELQLTDADRAVGVTWQAMVKLGDKWHGEPIRVIRITKCLACCAPVAPEIRPASDRFETPQVIDISIFLPALAYKMPGIF